jgi:hypothetical protein
LWRGKKRLKSQNKTVGKISRNIYNPAYAGFFILGGNEMATPFDMNNLNPGGIDPQVMGLAQGLLGAAGPSRMPMGLGQALAQGLQDAQQAQYMALHNHLMKLKLAKQIGLMNKPVG